jgi:hypothetical protein
VRGFSVLVPSEDVEAHLSNSGYGIIAFRLITFTNKAVKIIHKVNWVSNPFDSGRQSSIVNSSGECESEK